MKSAGPSSSCGFVTNTHVHSKPLVLAVVLVGEHMIALTWRYYGLVNIVDFFLSHSGVVLDVPMF
jgi:hypothetical protein